MNKEYAVVDKVKGILIANNLTQQEAWTKWQGCWMVDSEDSLATIARYTMGKYKSIKKYLK